MNISVSGFIRNCWPPLRNSRVEVSRDSPSSERIEGLVDARNVGARISLRWEIIITTQSIKPDAHYRPIHRKEKGMSTI